MSKSVIALLTIFLFTSCQSEVKEQQTSTSPDLIEQKATENEAVTDSIEQQQHSSEKLYRKVFLYGNKLQLFIPSYFTEMTSLMKQSKYPSGNSPDVVYTNEEGTVNIAFKHTSTLLADANLTEIQTTLLQQLQPTHPESLNHRIETVNGSRFGVIEFTSQAMDAKVYNLMFLTELEGKMLLGTFNCTEALKGEWQHRAKEILSSVRKG